MTVPGASITPSQAAAHERSRRFHASIAARAVTVQPSAAPEPPKPAKVPAPRPRPALTTWAVQIPSSAPSMIWPAYVRDRDPLPFTPKIAEIQRIMCEHFEVSREDMFSLRRGTKVLWARHVAIYFARRLTMHSFPEIGRMFGKRDHSTILSAVRKMEHLIEKNEGIAAEIARLTDKIMMASS